MEKVLVLIFVLMLISGCTTVQPVTTTSNDTVFAYRERVDTVIRDRWHTLLQKADTIWQKDSIVIYCSKYLRDTIYHSSTDTVTVTVAAQLSKWQQGIQRLGYGALGLIMGVIAWIICKVIIKFL